MQNYKTFSDHLNDYFKDNIKLSYISIRSVIIITKKDEKFYEFDKIFFNENKNSLIILRQDNAKNKSLIENSIVEELCEKGIIDIKSGNVHKMALTIDGKVYSWGNNWYGSLGVAKPISANAKYKPVLNHFLSSFKVIDISCGLLHTLVLTSNNEVYAWGYNENGQVGIGSKTLYVNEPFKLNSFNGEKVKAISCCRNHSIILTESGKLFCWGSFKLVQLACETSKFEHMKIPTLIDTRNLSFEKIYCGLDYTLLLTRDGDIYVFGCNDYGQLGTGDDDQLKPIMLTHSEKFTDIAGHYNTFLLPFSCAKSKSGLCYVWGHCGDKTDSDTFYEPKVTHFKSFNEIFAEYFYITYKPNEGLIIKLFDDIFTIRSISEKNRYDSEEYIGEGSYGKVFKVTERPFHVFESFALKKIVFCSESEEERVTQIKELETTSHILKLNDIRLVKYFKVWIENYYFENGIKFEKLTLYIQMEICDRCLTQIIEEINQDVNLRTKDTFKPLGYSLIIEIFIQILEGLNYLHKNEIIHRDLKPDNILLKISYDEKKKGNSKNFIKIGDYGLIAIHKNHHMLASLKGSNSEKHTKQLHTTDIGDLQYAAPEILDGEEYDTKADIYSLGKVLLDLLNIDKESFEDDINGYRNEIMKKYSNYEKIVRLLFRMLSEISDYRPDCQSILFNNCELISYENFSETSEEDFKKVYKFYKDKSYVFELLKIVTKN